MARTLIHVLLPWMQVLNPCKFQSAVLAQRGSDTVVQASKQPAFAAYYMPATADLVKEVFAAEAAGAITQGLSVAGEDKAFGGFNQPSSSPTVSTVVVVTRPVDVAIAKNMGEEQSQKQDGSRSIEYPSVIGHCEYI
jgi:hypothetical protein